MRESPSFARTFAKRLRDRRLRHDHPRETFYCPLRRSLCSNPPYATFLFLSAAQADIRKIAAQARAAGSRTVVGNTFLSPALQQPVRLGADLVVHSTTKFLNGHSDVVGGVVVAATQRDVDELTSWANVTGVTGSPFDSYLTLRGVRTMFVRVEQQQRTAAAIAEFLDRHPAVAAVHYPGLRDRPRHEIARAQQNGFGSMLSFEIVSGCDGVRRFLEALEVFTLAELLGGTESLVAHPATMSPA